MRRNERREMAACCIQRWWRKVNIRRRAGDAAMKRMMETKRKQMEAKLNMQKKKVGMSCFGSPKSHIEFIAPRSSVSSVFLGRAHC